MSNVIPDLEIIQLYL